MTMRHSAKNLEDKLKQDIIYPPYYHDYAEFERLEVTQGQFFADRAHYEKTDQIMCAVDGEISLAMVPHVYRQEMMPTSETSYYHESLDYDMSVTLDVNESPINLFKPDFDKYPSGYFIKHFYRDVLQPGDCMYIPAFYFY